MGGAPHLSAILSLQLMANPKCSLWHHLQTNLHAFSSYTGTADGSMTRCCCTPQDAGPSGPAQEPMSPFPSPPLPIQGAKGLFLAGMHCAGHNNIDNHEAAIISGLRVAARLAPDSQVGGLSGRLWWLEVGLSPPPPHRFYHPSQYSTLHTLVLVPCYLWDAEPRDTVPVQPCGPHPLRTNAQLLAVLCALGP